MRPLAESSSDAAPRIDAISSVPVNGSKDSVINNIQVLRFVASVLVVLAHAVDLAGAANIGKSVFFAGNLENLGAVGVDIFFVISGFIITRSVLSSPQSGSAFLRNRLIRILPLYYLLSLPWLWFALKHAGLDLSVLAATFLLFPAAGDAVVFPALLLGWTLCFEMLFYLSFALILFAGSWFAIVALLSVYVAMWAVRVTTELPVAQFLGNPIIIEFLFGVAIALAGRLRSRSVMRLCFALAITWLAATIVVGFGRIDTAELVLNGEVSMQRVLIWGIPSALLVLGASGLQAKTENPVALILSYLGDASYSIYLAHLLVFRALQRPLDFYQPNTDLVIFFSTLSAIAAGVIVHEWIEKPMTRSFRARFGQPTKLPAGGRA
jgi:exopolysaccharide production protein ExoZ